MLNLPPRRLPACYAQPVPRGQHDGSASAPCLAFRTELPSAGDALCIMSQSMQADTQLAWAAENRNMTPKTSWSSCDSASLGEWAGSQQPAQAGRSIVQGVGHAAALHLGLGAAASSPPGEVPKPKNSHGAYHRQHLRPPQPSVQSRVARTGVHAPPLQCLSAESSLPTWCTAAHCR